MPPFPSPIKTWHSESYPAIDPSQPQLAQKNKVVAITGAGGSIGSATALGFAKAGAKVALIGRTLATLQSTQTDIEKSVPGAEIVVIQGDISDAYSIRAALNDVKTSLGEIDILVANAGYLSTFQPLEKAEPGDWWKGFEVNVGGAFNSTRALLPNMAAHAILVEVSTGPIHMPAMAQASSYFASKMAATKVYETFGAENENVEVVHLHPGVILSELNKKSGIAAIDSADLPGNFIVWVSSPEAKFLRGGGKFLWVNWDVEELKSRKAELEKPNVLTITMNGFPFGDEVDGEAMKF